MRKKVLKSELTGFFQLPRFMMAVNQNIHTYVVITMMKHSGMAFEALQCLKKYKGSQDVYDCINAVAALIAIGSSARIKMYNEGLVDRELRAMFKIARTIEDMMNPIDLQLIEGDIHTLKMNERRIYLLKFND